MLHLRLNAKGFLDAAGRLAKRRYCAPTWVERPAERLNSELESEPDIYGDGSSYLHPEVEAEVEGESEMTLWDKAQAWRRKGNVQVHAREIDANLAGRVAVLQHWLPLAAACGVDPAVLEEVAVPLFVGQSTPTLDHGSLCGLHDPVRSTSQGGAQAVARRQDSAVLEAR